MARLLNLFNSVLVLSVLFTTTCVALESAEYCTKEVLGNTPAARNNSCTLREFHKTANGECFVLFQNCKAKVFNPKVNQVVDFVIPSVAGTFPNHENLKELRMQLVYNVNVVLAMAKPQAKSQSENPGSTAVITTDTKPNSAPSSTPQ